MGKEEDKEGRGKRKENRKSKGKQEEEKEEKEMANERGVGEKKGHRIEREGRRTNEKRGKKEARRT